MRRFWRDPKRLARFVQLTLSALRVVKDQPTAKNWAAAACALVTNREQAALANDWSRAEIEHVGSQSSEPLAATWPLPSGCASVGGLLLWLCSLLFVTDNYPAAAKLAPQRTTPNCRSVFVFAADAPLGPSLASRPHSDGNLCLSLRCLALVVVSFSSRGILSLASPRGRPSGASSPHKRPGSPRNYASLATLAKAAG